MPRRILIMGEQGQLAQALAHTYSARGDVAFSIGRSSLDITDSEAVCSAVARFGPELVINTAAYTAVDRAEEEAERAFSVNRDGACHVAASASKAGIPIIHISTDYVFDGTKPTPYVESDPPNPVGIYGRSKFEGELRVAAHTTEHMILRTSWLYSPVGTNFVKTMLRLAGEREEITVVDDQWGCPTLAMDLAHAIGTIAEAWLSNEDRSTFAGIYHVAGSGTTTWYQFACAIMRGSAARGGPACRVRAIPTSQYPTRARRPANSRFDCTKLFHRFGLRLPFWEISLGACLDQLIPFPQISAS